MAFQIKDFASCTASMINYLKGIQSTLTDFNVGSVVRSILESAAIEFEELYLQMFQGLRESIPVAVLEAFGYTKNAAVKASGMVQFTLSSALASDYTIASGTKVRVTSSSTYYTTSAALTISAGATVGTVRVVASTSGASGNVAAEAIDEIVGGLDGVSVLNLVAFTNGADAETDSARVIRFRGYVSSLARGTPAALAYAAKTAQLTDSSTGAITEAILYANCVEPYATDSSQPAAWVKVYVHNGSGSTSAELVALSKKIIYGYYDDDGTAVAGWKAAGVRTDVLVASDQTVDVTLEYSGSAAESDIESAVATYISGLDVGVSVVLAEIYAAVMALDGMTNCIPVISGADASTGELAVASEAKAIPGTITCKALS